MLYVKWQISLLFLYSIFSSNSWFCLVKEGYINLVMFHTFINFIVATQKLFICTLPEIFVIRYYLTLLFVFSFISSLLCCRVCVLLYCACVNLWRYSEVFSSSFSISLLNKYSSISPFFVFSAWSPCSVSWPVVMCHSPVFCYGIAHVGRTCHCYRIHREWAFKPSWNKASHFAPVLWYPAVDRHRQRKFSQRVFPFFNTN
jgi:hypothetical protein